MITASREQRDGDNGGMKGRRETAEDRQGGGEKQLRQNKLGRIKKNKIKGGERIVVLEDGVCKQKKGGKKRCDR